MTLPWLLLIVAGLFEVAWAATLKQTHGWTRLWPSLATIGLMVISFALLARAMRDLPAGTSYAVWTGIGTVGVAIVGMVWLGESVHWTRIACIAIIVVGIVGLKVTGGGTTQTMPPSP